MFANLCFADIMAKCIFPILYLYLFICWIEYNNCISHFGIHTTSAVLGESVVCIGDSTAVVCFYQCHGVVSAGPDRNTGPVKPYFYREECRYAPRVWVIGIGKYWCIQIVLVCLCNQNHLVDYLYMDKHD